MRVKWLIMLVLSGAATAQPVRRGVDMEAMTGASFRTPMGFDQMRDAGAGMRALQEQRRAAARPVVVPVRRDHHRSPYRG